MRLRTHAAVALLVLVGAAPLAAQGPWTVTLRQSWNPLPIGTCHSVGMSVFDPSIRGNAKNGSGGYVSLADFDMDVATSGNPAAVGKYESSTVWSVCACQSATVGQQGTITATYPGKGIKAGSVVGGVAFKTSASFTFSAAESKYNPPGCEALKTTIARSAGPPTSGRASPAPAPAPVTVAAGRGNTPPPTGLAAPVATPSGGTRPPVITVAGPAPSGVALTGTPLVALITWNAMPDAQRYAVFRGSGGGVSAERTPPSYTRTQFQDTVSDPFAAYRYSVIAYYANGTSGEAPVVFFTSPPLINPTGFTVRDRSNDRNIGGVDFKWNKVPGAVRYRITGTGLTTAGVTPLDTTIAVGNTPSGPGSWRLVSLYAGNVSDTTTAAVASTVVRRLPPHSVPWLTHRNGAGLPFQVQTPAHQEADNSVAGSPVGNLSGDLMPVYEATYATWLGKPFRYVDGLYEVDLSELRQCVGTEDDYMVAPYVCQRPGLKIWLDTYAKLWDEPEQAANEVHYGNPGDLGVGRRTWCEQNFRGPPTPGFYTICYATAHGVPPGQPGFNDRQTITHPGEGTGSDFILSMVITKDANGSVFLVLGKNGKYNLSTTVQLDTEGPKLVPFTCISCHGGTYNAATRKVDGAEFLPLDPELLAFASPEDQAGQEEKIREINAMIVNSDRTSAVAAYLRGLYGNAVGVSGTHATPDYVPQGWAPQAGFYRQVVRPYCATCHLAAPASWNFASWDNFNGNAALIRADVCSQHTMPHAELQYKAFWTKDTGPVYLPGLLASTLGFPSCP